jgi:hypothetical protein
VKKFCRILASMVTVLLLSSCVANSKYESEMQFDISKSRWVENNGDAALPLAAAMNFCGKEATDESAKIAAVLSLDKTYAAASSLQVLETNSLDTVKANEMSKCMTGLGYGRNEL